ncbi:uncharacterized protein BX664DRAFT_325609 [Halteromyces radiatus]|uniref:uncharacterized protein n=1 Tax=Halteromyces radiatus TaxID=101107 RepID=UPI0022202453|nr:uncharacterized protein BX664DRAFT_325609 [Halteromyces radiatus]KAI8097123.1 hypothetical protein BX664DRAFT_325609 [Halteromyces radiatus]
MDPLFLGLDPLFRCRIKLFIKDVLDLIQIPEYNDIYYFIGHPICEVEICGVIVAVEQTHTMLTYFVDDGSGVVPCYWWKDIIDIEETILLGTCVLVQGQVSSFKGGRQIKIQDLAIVNNPNTEVLHYLEVMTLRRGQYKTPFIIPDNIKQQRAKLEMEVNSSKTPEALTSSQVTRPEPQQRFQESLLAHVKRTYDTTKTFTIQHLQYNIQLGNSATRILRNQLGTEPTMQQLKQFFSTTCSTLEKEGYFIKGQYIDSYSLFDIRELETAIEQVIRNALELDTAGTLCGVRHNYICMKIQHDYRQLSKATIENCIESMVRQSILYMTDPGTPLRNRYQKGTSGYMLLED